MSNLMNTVEQNCDSADAPCSAIETILSPRVANLGGFSVRRLLPTAKRKMVGPWVFFDEMGPAEFPAGQGLNVLPHPHIGIATVTYLFEGEILHRDSVGSYQPIQLWLALPQEHEETAPAFHHYPEDDIPAVEIDGVPVRVMIGSAYGVTSPVLKFSETLYLEATLKTGQTLALPQAPERAVYVASGALRAHGSELPTHSMTIFSRQPGVAITATEDTRIAVIGGEPLGKRFIEWNFVSSSKARIGTAREDWRAGRFEKVVGDEEAYIPY